MSFSPGNLDTSDLSANAGILGTQIADNTIQTRNIAPGSIIAEQIVNQTITIDQIDFTSVSGPRAYVSTTGGNGDYTDIQTAIDYVSQLGGGTVFIREGTYTLTSDLTLASAVNLQGEKESVTIIDFNGNSASIAYADTGVYSTGTITSVSGGVNVTGSGTSWLANVTAGQYLFLANRHYPIAAVTSDTTLILAEGYIGNATLPGASYRISTILTDVDFAELTIENSTAAGMNIEGCKNITLTNMTFYANNIGIEWQYVTENAVKDVVVTSSVSDGVQFTNVGFGNINGFFSTSNGGNGFTFNTLETMPFLFCASTSNTGVGISATALINSYLTFEASANGGQGIEFVAGCNNNFLIGVQAASNTSDGLKLTASSTGNAISQSSFAVNGGYGINIAASSCAGNVIEPNVFSSNTSGTVSDSGTGTVIAATTNTTQTLSNKDLSDGSNTFPTFNQSTTGSAAKWTTARLLAGNSVDGSADVAFSNKFIAQGTSDSGLSGAQFLGSLGTGIVKNTTTTGVLSIAVAGDFPTLNQNTTGSAATLTTPRALWGQNFDGSAAVTGSLTSVGDITGGASSMTIQSGTGASRTLTFKTTTSGSAATTALVIGADQSSTFSGTVALGSNNLTMTGSIAATGARVTKGWFTDLEITNSPTVGGTALSSLYQPLDSDLTTIAGLTATTNNFIQSASSAWASRTPTQVTATLDAMVGDSGSGGTKGLVPAPGAGDASKFLKGDGTWGTASGSSPLTTKGDVYTFSTVDARLGVGTDGQVLTADSTKTTGLKWATPAGGGDMLAATYDPAGIAQQLVGTTATQTLTNKTLTTPKITTILDPNSNTLLTSSWATSAVNSLSIQNAATGSSPVIGVTGADTNIDLVLGAAGTGSVRVGGDTIATLTATQTLTNKTISGSSNTLSNIANAALSNSAITIAGTSTSLGGSITQDTITGLSSTGLVKRTGANTLATVTAPSGAVVGDTDTQTLTNKTLTSPIISSISNTGTLTLPTSTDTLVGRATTDTLTNKTITDTSNSVSYAAFTNPYKFSVYQTSNQTVGTGDTKINFDTKEFDTGTNFDLTNDIFTAPVAGYYFFSGTVTWSNNASATAYVLSMYKNTSTEILRGTDIRGTNIVGAQTISGIFQLSSSDTVELRMGTGGHSVATVASQTNVRFCGFLISRN